MDNKEIKEALKKAREGAKKRNFSQTIEFNMNFKGLNLKSPDHQMDFYTLIKHPWKETKICGLVGPELSDQAKEHFDMVITADEFDNYSDKKKVKELARKYDYFVAQANLMPQVAKAFGRYFGPVNKMPNPKAGCVVPPNANLEALKQKLQKTVRVFVKTIPMFQIGVGKETSKDEEVAEDIMGLYNQILHHLPAEHQNIKSMYVKLSMGKPERLQ